MILTRQKIEQREYDTLVSYAAISLRSRGRQFAQAEHPLRTSFQRDRDRVIHSAAFRRMEYKTQVFISYEQDHFRTRLTHTIEVAQISRTLARSLCLNEDLAEVVALVHDLGHTPFGHAGENILDALLKPQGGFNHNCQSLRVVDILEQRYPKHPGLNLSYEVREGIVKHETKVKIELPEFDSSLQPTLEASLVDIADEIAYNAHDIDDGISSGLIRYDDLTGQDFFHKLVGDRLKDVDRLQEDYRRYALIRALIDRMALDVLSQTAERITDNKIDTLDSVRACPNKLVGYSDSMAPLVGDLKKYLNDNLYQHPRLKKRFLRAQDVLGKLFNTILNNSDLLPERFQQMLNNEQREIVTADYVAGMTDRFAELTYDRICSN